MTVKLIPLYTLIRMREGMWMAHSIHYSYDDAFMQGIALGTVDFRIVESRG